MADGLKPVCLRRRKRSRRTYWQFLGNLRLDGYDMEWFTVRRMLELREANPDYDNRAERPREGVVE